MSGEQISKAGNKIAYSSLYVVLGVVWRVLKGWERVLAGDGRCGILKCFGFGTAEVEGK